MTSQLPHSVKEISAFSFNRIIEDGENLGLNQNTEDGKNWVLNQLMWLLYNFMPGSVISKNKCKGFSIVVVFSYFSVMPCVEYSMTIFCL